MCCLGGPTRSVHSRRLFAPSASASPLWRYPARMLDQVRLFTQLDSARRILLAGAGGGFDVYAGVPLYAALRRRGHEVFLGNLSFTHLASVKGDRLTAACIEVGADTPGPDAYFPERSLARFLAAQGMPTRIFAFDKQGVVPVRAAYHRLIDELKLDAIVLVDGGTDILMRGDEQGLGTPTEDMTSLAAVRPLDVEHKAVCCIGFGIDTFHGVRHTQFLENVADLSTRDGFWGSFSVVPGTEEARLYLEAVEHAATQTQRASIVNGSIASAVEGAYGNVHRYPSRTRGSTLWINPLMSIYWAFDLEQVAAANLYLDELEGTKGVWDVQLVIEAVRHRLPRRDGPVDIPV